jgi:hypothetical protein
VALVVGAFAAGLGTWAFLHCARVQPRVARFTIVPAASQALVIGTADRNIAVPADGSRIVYVGGGGEFYVRSVDQLEAVPLRNLGTARAPFLSPDGQ